MCSRSTPVAFSSPKGGQFKGKGTAQTSTVLSTKSFTLQISLLGLSTYHWSQRLPKKAKNIQTRCFYTVKSNKGFISPCLLILFTKYWEKSLAHGRTISPSYAKIFFWEIASSYISKRFLRVWQELHNMGDSVSSLWCQRWQSIALAQQKRILCLFQTLLKVEMHLHPVECFEGLSAVHWMLCLRAPKRLEKNKEKKRILILVPV